MVKHARRTAYGDDEFMAMEMKYGSKPKKDSFLMFSAMWVDDKGTQRVVGFAEPQLMKLLKYKKINIHIDATFRGTPKGFYQVLIVSVMDNATNMHTPIFYCPMTTKTEEAYNITLMHIRSCVGKSSGKSHMEICVNVY